MSGRMENEINIINGVEAKLNHMPEYVKGWYMNLRASKNTAETCRVYINNIHLFLSFINENVKEISVDEINQMSVMNFIIKSQTKEKNGEVVYTSDSYQQMVWCCMNNFLQYLYETGLIKRNYLETIAKPKNRDLERINENRILLTAKDFKKIIKAIDTEPRKVNRYRNKAVLMLFMNTGMRRTALSNVTLDDVDIEQKTLTVIDKGNKRHVYILNEQVIDALKEWLNVRHEYNKIDGTNYLFLSDRGNRMSSSAVYEVVEKYTQIALGKKVSPHKLRSGYCSILYKKTGDIEFVRRAVGHANATTTQRYIVTKGEEKRKASEIMGSIF